MGSACCRIQWTANTEILDEGEERTQAAQGGGFAWGTQEKGEVVVAWPALFVALPAKLLARVPGWRCGLRDDGGRCG